MVMSSAKLWHKANPQLVIKAIKQRKRLKNLKHPKTKLMMLNRKQVHHLTHFKHILVQKCTLSGHTLLDVLVSKRLLSNSSKLRRAPREIPS